MKRQNIFFGRGKQAELADHLYKRFMSRQWFSYDDVMTDSGKKEYPNLSSCDGYGELKKLFGIIKLGKKMKKEQVLYPKLGMLSLFFVYLDLNFKSLK